MSPQYNKYIYIYKCRCKFLVFEPTIVYKVRFLCHRKKKTRVRLYCLMLLDISASHDAIHPANFVFTEPNNSTPIEHKKYGIVIHAVLRSHRGQSSPLRR